MTEKLWRFFLDHGDRISAHEFTNKELMNESYEELSKVARENKRLYELEMIFNPRQERETKQ